jgi:hypothetical protein
LLVVDCLGQVVIPLTASDLTGERSGTEDEEEIIQEIRGGQYGAFKLDLQPAYAHFMPKAEKTGKTLPFGFAEGQEDPEGTVEIQVSVSQKLVPLGMRTFFVCNPAI